MSHLFDMLTSAGNPRHPGMPSKVGWGKVGSEDAKETIGSTWFYHVLSLGVLKQPLFSGGS